MRQPADRDAGIQAHLTIKVLFGLPLRKTAGFVESGLELVDLDWAAPDICTLCHRKKTLPVSLPYEARGTAEPYLLLAAAVSRL